MPASLTQWDLDNFDRILAGEADHFSAHLVRLIKRADQDNRRLLRRSFAYHVTIVQIWEHAAPCRMWICRECGETNVRKTSEPQIPCGNCKRGEEPPLPERPR